MSPITPAVDVKMKPKKYPPMSDWAKACTDEMIPLRVIKVPNSVN